MGYLLLAIALFAGTTKCYCGKRISGYINEYNDAILTTLVRMVFCVIIGFFITVLSNGFNGFRINTLALSISLISGTALSVFVVSWLISIKNGAFMMVEIFPMLGMIIPLLGSYIRFGEKIMPIQLVGLFLLPIAAWMMYSYNNSIRGRMKFKYVIVLVICGISNGLSDFSQKLFVEMVDGISIETFNFYTYVFSVVILGLCVLLSKNNIKEEQQPFCLKNTLGYLIIMSICLFANSYFQTRAAVYIPSVQLYPLSKGCALVLSMLMSAVFFKEHISVKCILGMLMAFVALLMINLL